MKNQAHAQDGGFYSYDFECVNCGHQQTMITHSSLVVYPCPTACGAKYEQVFKEQMPSLICIVCPRIIPVQEAA